MKRNPEVDLSVLSEWGRLVLSVIKNPYVLAGVVCLAVFFFLYLAALSWADLSFVMPLTAMSYIFAALLARFLLKEDVSWFRWAGTAVITLGIIFIALDGRQRSAEPGTSRADERPQTLVSVREGIPVYQHNTGRSENHLTGKEGNY